MADPPEVRAPELDPVVIDEGPRPIEVESERWPHTVGQLAFWFFLVPLIAMIALWAVLNRM